MIGWIKRKARGASRAVRLIRSLNNHLDQGRETRRYLEEALEALRPPEAEMANAQARVAIKRAIDDYDRLERLANKVKKATR